MTSDQWKKLDALFHEALELQGEARTTHLAKVCANDEQLRAEAERLLAAHEREGSFIDSPIFAEAAERANDGNESPVGRSIGHYRVVSQLGRGGMGEVYLAEDGRLERKVALKVLPAAFTENRDRVQRFEREAKAASALNHPNILTIHEIGEVDGAHYIVSEFVEGETLRAMIERSKLSVSEAISIAEQVAGALSVAHRAGIIHRDIKPENVMVRPDGLVKVLDFGLAKLTERAATPAEVDSQAQILARLSTEPGVVMGTASYMSPEQARGQKVDHRTDIFSLGVMLYEMVAGCRPFVGTTTSETIAAILRDEPPPLTAHEPNTPRELERIIGKTLRKECEERYQIAKDLLFDLKSFQQESNSAAAGTAMERGATRSRLTISWLRLTLVASVALLAVIGGLLWWYFWRETPPPIGRSLPLTSDPGFELNPALSPDSKQVAFAWNGDKQDNFDIYIRQVGTHARAQLTKHPAEDLSPAWSPDGNTIAFLRRVDSTRNELLLISALGGTERRLAEVVIADGTRARLSALAWSPDGRWLAVADRATGDETEGLFLISAQTGEKRRLTGPPTNASHDAAPTFSPDGRTLMFTRISSVVATAEVFLLQLSADFAPVGDARPLKTSERFIRSPVWTPDGRSILFLAAPNLGFREQTQLRKIAASGAGVSEQVAVLEGAIEEMSLGRHLVFTRYSNETDIWRAEIPPPGRPPDQPQPFISSTRIDNQPKYSPDGKKIAFGSTRSGAPEIWVADADGSNPVPLTSFGGPLVGIKDWSPDSQRLVFHARPEGQADIFTIPASGGVPKRLTTDPADDTAPSYSRDGRWIYFNSARSGQYVVWKMPAAGGDAVKLTSVNSGTPVESFDGKTLYFQHLGPEGGIWKMPVEGGAAVQLTGPINQYAYAVGKEGIFYSPAPDATQKGSLQFFSFATGKTRTVVVADYPIGGLIGLSPDQRFLAFAQRGQYGRDLMLIENFVVR
ncbi:MAG: serine/threonine-protein kinase [Acidobacteria bacterium]|nr:serine/threonine-protein kinase [Acidobacteriota bacterium]